MSKRRTYEQKLLDDLRAMPHTRWFRCKEPPEYDRFVKQIKVFIDCGEPFEFNENYTKVRRIALTQEPIENIPYHKMKKLPPGITIEIINRGDTIEVDLPKGRTYVHTWERKHYRILKNGNEITIES